MLSGVRIRRQVIDMPAGLFLDEHPRFFWFPGCLVNWPGNQWLGVILAHGPIRLFQGIPLAFKAP
jgi:hypothetical protein